MTSSNWKRAGVGACTAAALVVGAALVAAPSANAAPIDGTAGTGLVSGVIGGVTGVLTGGTPTGGTPTAATSAAPTASPTTDTTATGTPSAPVTIAPASGTGISVGVGAGSTTGGTPGVVVTVGGVLGGASGSGGATVTPTPDPSTSPTPAPSTTPTAAPATLSALSIAAQYGTVYPARDGYRDTVGFQLSGTASDGQQHAASGTATVRFGSAVVATWAISATNQAYTWDGLNGGAVVPGDYSFTAAIGDPSTAVVSTTIPIHVSAAKLIATTTRFVSTAISGTHRMAAKPRAGLSTGKVTLRIVTRASGVKGKQYLEFVHAGRVLKIRILNGKHASKTITIPKSFTSFTIRHTWKKGTVRISSLQYEYRYRALR